MRLFVGIPAFQGLENEALLKKIKVSASRRELDVKWSPLPNYHLTLSFLGEVSAEQVSTFETKLRELAARHKPFDLEIHDVGAFPEDRSGRVIWLGVKKKKDLQALAEDSISTFQVAQNEEFVPHITIGRLRNPANLTDVMSPLKRKSFGKVNVRELVLYESQLQSYFPVYKPLLSVPL